MNRIDKGFADKLDTAFMHAVSAFNAGTEPTQALATAAKHAGMNEHGARRLVERFNTARLLSLRRADKLATFVPSSPDDVAMLVGTSDAVTKGASARVHAAHVYYEDAEPADKVAGTSGISGRAPLAYPQTACQLPTSKRAAPVVDVADVQDTLKMAEILRSECAQGMERARRACYDVVAKIGQARDGGIALLVPLVNAPAEQGESMKFAVELVLDTVPPLVRASAEKVACPHWYVPGAAALAVMAGLDKAAELHAQALEIGRAHVEAAKLASELRTAAGYSVPEPQGSAIDGLIKQSAGGGAAQEKDEDTDKKDKDERKPPASPGGAPAYGAVNKLDSWLYNHVKSLGSGINAAGSAARTQAWSGANSELENAGRAIALQRMIAGDPLLSGAPPERLRSVLSTLHKFSPHILDDQEVVRSVLRQGVNSQAIDPFAAKAVADLDQAVVRQDQPTPAPQSEETRKGQS